MKKLKNISLNEVKTILNEEMGIICGMKLENMELIYP